MLEVTVLVAVHWRWKWKPLPYALDPRGWGRMYGRVGRRAEKMGWWGVVMSECV